MKFYLVCPYIPCIVKPKHEHASGRDDY